MKFINCIVSRTGGWVGYFSYDTVRYVEKKKLPPQKLLSVTGTFLTFIWAFMMMSLCLTMWRRLDQFSSVEEAYDDGMTRLEALVSRVHDIVPPRLASGSIKLHTSLFGPSLSKSTMTREEYQKAVIEAKEHSLAGDIFQIVLSQRFERRTFADPFEVYRALRIVNPSPYMTYKLEAASWLLQVMKFSLELRRERSPIVLWLVLSAEARHPKKITC